mmetsp:Transcript_75497/g.164702  ORF Transcript_75497/g.164702 Transcript_75497/m.164702 type:complete len:224 (-) Transcript_75497:32-703(-)
MATNEIEASQPLPRDACDGIREQPRPNIPFCDHMTPHFQMLEIVSESSHEGEQNVSYEVEVDDRGNCKKPQRHARIKCQKNRNRISFVQNEEEPDHVPHHSEMAIRRHHRYAAAKPTGSRISILQSESQITGLDHRKFGKLACNSPRRCSARSTMCISLVTSQRAAGFTFRKHLILPERRFRVFIRRDLKGNLVCCGCLSGRRARQMRNPQTSNYCLFESTER